METNFKVDVPSFALGYSAGKKKGGSGGGVELNIAYGDTPPEDTSKLWVKTSEPNKVTIKPNPDDFQYTDELKVPQASNTAGSYAYGCCAAIGDSIYYVCGTSVSAAAGNSFLERYYKSGEVWYKQQLFTDWSKCPFNACCMVVGHIIYILGGHYYSGYNLKISKAIYAVDTEQKTHAAISTSMLPNTLARACCASVGDTFEGKTYVFGGNTTATGSGHTDAILRIDHETLEATQIEAKLPEKTQMLFCAAVGTKIYVFGGHGYDSGVLNTICCFDTETEKLEQLEETLPVPLACSACVASGENIYIFGGCTNDLAPSNDIYRFNTRTRKISMCNSKMSFGQVGGCAAINESGMLLFYGGEYKNTEPFIQNASNAVRLFIEGEDFPLVKNALQVVTSETKNIFTVAKANGFEISMGVDAVFKGDSNGVSEKIDAALYQGGEWKTI